MKNQYFADTRDLFKYDLIAELIKYNPSFRNVTFIPMLTKDDSSQHGSKIDYSRAKAGIINKNLVSFLRDCLKRKRRNIKEIKRFFSDNKLNRKILFTIYKSDEYLNKNNRNSYFDDITPNLLSNAVILLDPDTGIEGTCTPKKSDKHLKYSEISEIYRKMNRGAVLLIFQFIPRVNRNKYFKRSGNELKKRIDYKLPILFISDSNVVFFLLSKTRQTNGISNKIIKGYSAKYNLIAGFI